MNIFILNNNLSLILIALLLETVYIWYDFLGGRGTIAKSYTIFDKKYGRIIRKLIIKMNEFLPVSMNLIHLVILNISFLLLSYSIYSLLNTHYLLILIALVLIECITIYIVKRKESESNNIDEAFIDSLYFFTRSYRVNTNLKESIIASSKYSTDKRVKKLYVDILKLCDYGLLPLQSIEEVFGKHKSTKVRLTLRLITLNRKTGLDLTKILERLSDISRINFKNAREVKNIMLQTKVSSVVTSLMVPFIVIGLLVMSNDYFNVLLNVQSGRIVLLLCAVWYLLGVYLVNRTLKKIAIKN